MRRRLPLLGERVRVRGNVIDARNEAALSFANGGNSINDYQGASVAQSIKIKGHFNLHFDENLKRVGPWR